MKMKLLILAAVQILYSHVLYAETVSHLFEAELPVVSQRSEVRMDAMRQGLKQILVRLTGDPDISRHADILAAEDKAAAYVQSYHYQPSSDKQSTKIAMYYDKDDISRLLRKANIPFWGETRPLILVWLVITDQNGDQVIGANEPNAYLSALREQSQIYGLPMIFPVMDVLDMHAVTPKDIVRNDVAALQKAAERYQPDAMLIGRINRIGEHAQTNWRLVMGKRVWDFDYVEDEPGMLSALLLNKMSATLMSRMMQQAADQGESRIHLRVTNIKKPEDFKRLTQFFKSISAVRQVQLEQVEGDVVDFDLLVQGSFVSFQENATIGKRLELQAENDEINQLIYEWKS